MARAAVVRDTEVAASLAARASTTSLAGDRMLPVVPPLASLLPGDGLQRGTVVTVDTAPGTTGAVSLALAVAAGPSQNGSWIAGVGLGSLGLVAAAELGVVLERFVLVADPHGGPGASNKDARDGWSSVVAALVDGFDVTLASATSLSGLHAGDVRRLVSRVRERGAVLLSVGGVLPEARSSVRLTVTAAVWEGLGEGWGHLQGRRVAIEATGRGAATLARRTELWLPASTGGLKPIKPLTEAIPLRRPPVTASRMRSVGTGLAARTVS